MENKTPPKDFIDALNEQEAAKKQEQDKTDQIKAINKAGIKNVEATNRTTEAVSNGLKPIAKSTDIDGMIVQLKEQQLATLLSGQQKQSVILADSTDLGDKVGELKTNLVDILEQLKNTDNGDKVAKTLVSQFNTFTDKLLKAQSSSDKDLQKSITALQKSLDSKNFAPVIKVDAPKVNVPQQKLDITPIADEIKNIPKPEPTDFSPLLTAIEEGNASTKAVKEAIQGLSFPVPNYVLPFKDSNGKATQVQLDASGNVPVDVTVNTGATTIADGADVAEGATTDAANTTGTTGTVSGKLRGIVQNQTNGTQKTKIIDASGTAFGTTSNPIFVSDLNSEPADVTGTFTNATQTTSITTSGSLDGYEAVTVSVNGTYGTASAVFEGSDDGGTTWYTLQGARTDSGTVDTGYTSLTNTTRMWTVQVTGLDSFRVRSTAVASGTVNVRISVSSAPTADASVVSVSDLTTGNQQTKVTDGTNVAAVKAASTAPVATDPALVVVVSPNQAAYPTTANISALAGNAILTGNGATGTGSARVTVANNNSAIANWGHGATGSAVPANAVYQGISDGTNTVGMKTASAAAATTGAGLLGAAALGIYNTSLPTITNGNYERIQLDVNGRQLVSGNTTAGATVGTGFATYLSDSSAIGRLQYNAATLTGGHAGTNSAAVTNNGYYNTTLPTYTNGQFGPTQMDVGGRQIVTLGTKLDPTNDSVTIGGGLMPTSTALNTYSVRLTTNTTTTPTSSTAYISSIVVCVETGGTTSTVDIRDKSGTPIYLVRSLSTAAVLGNGDLVYNFQTPIKMTSGIDIITAGAAAATVSVFINYYQ